MQNAPSDDLDAPTAATPAVSSEVFVVPLQEDRYLVYAPLRQAAFVANASMVNFIADVRDGRAETAASGSNGELASLLERLEIIHAGPEQPPATSFQGTPKPVSITLFLTTGCNLRCSYCYASAGDAPARVMSLETAQRGIRHVAENAISAEAASRSGTARATA
jgi:uncharacterized protein